MLPSYMNLDHSQFLPNLLPLQPFEMVNLFGDCFEIARQTVPKGCR